MFDFARTLRTVAALACIAPVAAGAQTAAPRAGAPAPAPFTEETRLGSVGLGLGGAWGGTGVHIGYERGVTRLNDQVVLSIGGQLGYVRDAFTEFVDVSYVPVSVTANAHFTVPSMPKVDLYGGISAGYVIANISARGVRTPGLSFSGETYGLQAGARYELTSKASVYGQLGIGDLSRLQAGIALKF
jgi:hypothetical protein